MTTCRPTTLGERCDPRDDAAELAVIVRFEHVELAQVARDTREEREAVELGLIDLGEGDA